MRTGDGLLVRLRLTGGIVAAPLARAIADCARAFGNGAIDLSARANLHIRGVSEITLAPLTKHLGELGALDENADAEAVRNIVASPMAGLDPAALLDIRSLVRALEQRFASDPVLYRLPPKFCVSIEDGGSFGLAELASDIRFRAYRTPNGPSFAVALGGTEQEAKFIGACAPETMAETAAALAHAFLALRGDGFDAPRRMAALIGRVGAAAIAARVKLDAKLGPDAPHPTQTRREPPLGFHALGDGGVFGVAAPFGRWSADSLAHLADLAEAHGAGELRLTIWRAILLPGVARESRPALAAACADLVIDPSDPRLALVACPGAPACSSATNSTRDDALALAGVARRLAPKGVTLHVSGCVKGCARPSPAPVTLVARDGLYDLVLDGASRDLPAQRGLTLGETRKFVEEMSTGTSRE